ncbi:TnsD family Tn7-like transposition protein [Gottfriedia acidiceleris]|uniref:TnsD family Tn7-like transposition protein n=1 Tax=Gottfriedia acidiceleris TaxID=371036 RepID=UPI000B44A46C|nr:TnsD family Tn7-like transposition protein [Gottfriedia acidiceleris]
MVFHFPTPYPDELLYSINARYHVQEGNTSPKHTIEELYGKATVTAVLDLPCNIDLLVGNINNTLITSDYLIDQHTLFPYYGAFLINEKYNRVRKLMKGESGKRVHLIAGLRTSAIKPKSHLMHCKDCFREDVETYGESYWHRSHQLPGVLVCYKHDCPLIESSISIKETNHQEYIPALKENVIINGNYVIVLNGTFRSHLQFAKLSHQLLNNKLKQQVPKGLEILFKNKLRQRGFVSVSGKVHREELYSSFLRAFTSEFLCDVQSSVTLDPHNWLTSMFQSHRKSFHPIRFLLLMMYFGGELGDYFNKSVEYLPFGKGPWLCLNPVCSNFKKPSVTDLKISRCWSTRRPVGTFSCKCGFVYSRRGPDKDEIDRYKIGFIKEYGEVWESTLKEKMKIFTSIRMIAREMGCAPNTVKKHATRLGISLNHFELKVELTYKISQLELNKESKINQCREKWLQIVSDNPLLSKTQLRRLNQNLYQFLYRRDYDWLKQNSPKVQRGNANKERINWKERDELILRKVKNLIENWDQNVEKPTRITIGRISRKLGIEPLRDQRKVNLPLTMEYLNKVVEGFETFRIRRIKLVVDKMINNGEELRKWKIKKRAGLNHKNSKEIELFISNIVVKD